MFMGGLHTACNDDGQQFGQLPDDIQRFIALYYPEIAVSLALSRWPGIGAS